MRLHWKKRLLLAPVFALAALGLVSQASAQNNNKAAPAAAPAKAAPAAGNGKAKKPNILVIWGDDIGTWNISHNSRGMMGYKTPNIDRIAREGLSYFSNGSLTSGWA